MNDGSSLWLDGSLPYEPTTPLEGDAEVDVAIVGAGYTGLSSAYHLSERFPDRRIALLEAHTVAHGASGRNGGLVLHDMPGVVAASGEIAKRNYDVLASTVAWIETVIATHGLPVELRREGCIRLFTSQKNADESAARIERDSAAGVAKRFLGADEVARHASAADVCGGSLDVHARHLDGARFLRALRGVLTARGVAIHEGTPVLRVREGATIELDHPRGTVRARAIVLATNAYSSSLGYFRAGIVPVHSHIVATEPIDDERLAEIGWREGIGLTDDRPRLFYASRTVDGRLVLGGGSNASYGYSFGSSPEAGPPGRGHDAVRAHADRYFPGLKGVATTHRWTGAVGLTADRVCSIGVRGEHRNFYYGVGYSGSGVVLANLAGRVIADIYCDDDERWRDLPFFQRKLPWIPPEPFRWLGYKIFTTLTGKTPRVASK